MFRLVTYLSNLPVLNLFGVKTYIHQSTIYFVLVMSCFAALELGGPISRDYGAYGLASIPYYIAAALVASLFLATIYFCVVLHEYGHAIAARLRGYPLGNITMYPIGGALEMKVTPYNDPFSEFIIAVSGPVVNLAICMVLIPFFDSTLGTVAHTLAKINITICAFNLIPVFPMDGGRVFRSLINLLGFHSLTATTVALCMAVAFCPLVLYYFLFVQFAPTVMLIMPLILIAGWLERKQVISLKRLEDNIASTKEKTRASMGCDMSQHEEFAIECGVLAGVTLAEGYTHLNEHERVLAIRRVVERIFNVNTESIRGEIDKLVIPLRIEKIRHFITPYIEQSVHLSARVL